MDKSQESGRIENGGRGRRFEGKSREYFYPHNCNNSANVEQESNYHVTSRSLSFDLFEFNIFFERCRSTIHRLLEILYAKISRGWRANGPAPFRSSFSPRLL